jgi:hypothetical protein
MPGGIEEGAAKLPVVNDNLDEHPMVLEWGENKL